MSFQAANAKRALAFILTKLPLPIQRPQYLTIARNATEYYRLVLRVNIVFVVSQRHRFKPVLRIATIAIAIAMALQSSTSDLKHIYFFVDQSAHTERSNSHEEDKSATSRSNGSPSRDSSPGSIHTATTTATTGTSSSSSDMNPLAKSFQPSASAPPSIPPKPTAMQNVDLQKTAEQGHGLFATSRIKRGTLIICEAPLLKIPDSLFHLAWAPYCRLSAADKATFDSLHAYRPEGIDFEQAGRMYPLDPSDVSLDADDVAELLAEQIRVMSIFSVNNILMPRSGLAMYAMASRLNHSCVPNVHHSYNPTLKQITVHAVRDIEPNEQLYTTYLGGVATYQIHAQRVAALRANYGFTCTCIACSDTTGTSDGRRELLGRLVWGLQQYEEGARPQYPFIPDSPAAALKLADDAIQLMNHEGLRTMELTKAMRAASTLALQCKDLNMAFQYARDEADVERACLGRVCHDLVGLGVAAQCWTDRLRDVAREETERRGEGKGGKWKKGGGQGQEMETVKSKTRTKAQEARQREKKLARRDKEKEQVKTRVQNMVEAATGVLRLPLLRREC